MHLIIFSSASKFDFEGRISDWVKTGTAFNNQPTYGDNPTARNRDNLLVNKGTGGLEGLRIDLLNSLSPDKFKETDYNVL